MNRLTDSDRNWGPFTLGRWSHSFRISIEGGNNDDPANRLLLVAFGWALRMRLPNWIKPCGKYREHSRCYGFSLSDMGNGYDFFSLYCGPQTHDSLTTKSWHCHFPWKEWRMVRHSLYTPSGEHFYTQPEGISYFDNMAAQEKAPKVHFRFADYDGELIIATCMIEEREWHRGRGCCKWLGRFCPPKIRRSLDLAFSAEVGPEKGSWKGGTIGHGIDMLDGESPEAAFRRYCRMDHERKGRKYHLRFIGPCSAPPAKVAVEPEAAKNS